jgi:hypothetical protein
MPAVLVLQLADSSESLLTLSNLFILGSESISFPVSSAEGASNVIRLLNWVRIHKTEMMLFNCISLL